MKSISIKGSKRESVGKVATKALRNAGMVPCVIYGGDKPVHFSSEEKAFKSLVYTPNVYTASIDVDGEKIAAILQDIQFHPVSDKILHVDFYQLFDDKEITMNIPLRLVGKSKGVAIGGALRQNLRKIKVKALPANLPDFIEADITELQIGNKLYISSLKNDDYAIMHPDNTVVAQVRMSRNASKAAVEETEE
ncbi:50S ribosomal protein L25/general stress protein Ctc [Polaribacter sp. Asnod1-A03]|uniref:50S ribosomal protein L25/general stress protein Ctc n=1 Tax=Polaribacter sp. Asnod1-A03 TaxID=3160581 RepID=UPI003864FDCD